MVTKPHVYPAYAPHAPGFASSEDRLEYDYKELVIAAAPGNGFRMEPNALHIWPRKSFMLIALPNRDGSFTGTLFYPHAGEASFESLTTPEAVIGFFEREFPDAAAMMPDLVEVFFGNPTGAMVTVKCAPWRIGGQLLLMGDAAHAIVPFFGQGMNCGFEDASRLGELLDADRGNWKPLFAELESARKPSTDAIAAMALENFVEMRDTVADPKFQLKKQIGFALEQRYPDRFIPRYAMVVFHPEISYHDARVLGEKQDKMLTALAAGISEVGELDWALADRLADEFSPRAATDR